MPKKRFKPTNKSEKAKGKGPQKEAEQPQENKKLKIITIIIITLILLSVVIIGVSQILNTASLDAKTSAYNRNAHLIANFSQNSLDYEYTINKSDDDGGGFIGLGVGDDVNFGNKSEHALYLKGLNEFQENLGLLLNSYKDRYYTLTVDVSDPPNPDNRSIVSVRTHVDLIPWWPIGMDQDCTITVEFYQKGAVQKAVINKVEIQKWYNRDETETKFEEYSVVWTTSPNAELTTNGQKKEFKHSFALEEDIGLVGLVAYVEITFYDAVGNQVDKNEVTHDLRISSDNPEMSVSKTINLNVLNEDQTMKLIMLLLSFPFSIISIVLAGIGLGLIVLYIFKEKVRTIRKGGYIILTAGIIQVLAVSFMYVGIENLVDVVNSVFVVDLRENFQWSPMLYVMYAAGAMLIIAALIILIFFRVPKEETTKDKPEKTKKKKEDTFQVISE